MKATCIYKTKKNYKIVTLHLSDTGIYVLGDPIIIVEANLAMKELSKNIFSSLWQSNEINYENYSQTSKELLKKMKETSFRKLYKNSRSCCIFYNGDKLLIKPKIYKNQKRGLEVIKEDVVSVVYSENNEEEITKMIIEVLQKEYPDRIT